MPPEESASIDRITTDLRPQDPSRPPQRSVRTLGERMRELATPGVSIAVVENFEVAWASGFGVRKMGEGAEVKSDTPFQAGSISKPVFALAVMRLCQDKRIDLNADIRTYLKSWQMLEGDGGWAPKVTFRQLLSHTAGTTVHGFPGYPASGPRPSLTQVLDGAFPANTPPVFVDLIPGMQFRYSGGGTTIAQLALTDLIGATFPDVMHELVLAPLGMKDSSYGQPPSSTLADRAAVGHPMNGLSIPGDWHVYPEMAAAGLWTTASDLARLGATLMCGLRGSNTDLGLSRESLSAMLRPQLPSEQSGSDFVGLAWFCEGGGDAFRFGHSGGNWGFMADLRLYPATGQGAAVMINSNQGWPLIDELLSSIGREYRWPATTHAKTGSSTSDQIAGAYRDRTNRVFHVDQVGENFLLRVDDQEPIPLMSSSDGILSAQVPRIEIRFAPTAQSSPTISLRQGGTTFEAIKVSEELHD